MSLGLLHQVGHNAIWNVKSFEDENCGDGLILSPLHQAKDTVENLSDGTRAASIFDAQFYLPNSRKKKLLSYPFFPEQLAGGFQTASFGNHALELATQCVDFQVENGFRKIVIPTRFIDEMYPDYFEMHQAFTVDAFIEAADNRPLCLALAVKTAMIKHAGWRRNLLDWITSFPEVDELYLMYENVRTSKQVHDEEFLVESLRFFRDVMQTDLKLTIGYTNTEGLLFSVAGNPNITMGAFENTRIFSLDKFIETEGERRGPKARIFLSGLLNWIQFEDARQIQTRAPEIWQRIYSPTAWADQALQQAVEPTFNQQPLYRHYFLNMNSEINYLKNMTLQERKSYLVDKIDHALAMYRDINSRGIQLERHGQASHLVGWRNALLNF